MPGGRPWGYAAMRLCGYAAMTLCGGEVIRLRLAEELLFVWDIHYIIIDLCKERSVGRGMNTCPLSIAGCRMGAGSLS